MRYSIAFGCVALAACSPRIDNTSPEACRSSTEKVVKAALASDSIRATSALFAYQLATTPESALGLDNVLTGGEQRRHVETPMLDSATAERLRCRALDGVSASQFVRQQDSLSESLKLLASATLDSGYVVALRAARDRTAAMRDSLSLNFEVVSARFFQSQTSLGLRATLQLRVRNQTGSVVSRAYFHGRLTTTGSGLPLVEQDFDQTVPGGLEPGASATWNVEPNPLLHPEWTAVRLPRDAVLEVTLLKLDGADQQPLWGGIGFGVADSIVLDSLSSVHPGW